jgi:hypothetical protein
MTPADFVAKWKAATPTERSAAQEHRTNLYNARPAWLDNAHRPWT